MRFRVKEMIDLLDKTRESCLSFGCDEALPTVLLLPLNSGLASLNSYYNGLATMAAKMMKQNNRLLYVENNKHYYRIPIKGTKWEDMFIYI